MDCFGELFVGVDQFFDGVLLLDGSIGKVVEAGDHFLESLSLMIELASVLKVLSVTCWMLRFSLNALVQCVFQFGQVLLPLGQRVHSFHMSVKSPHWMACLVPVVTIVSSEIATFASVAKS